MQMINGRYLLHEKLGQGGMGIVHRATDRLTGDIVALKQVFLPVEQLLFASRPASQTNRELRLALAHEFQTLASMRHPHIISVLDYGFDEEKRPFFTMSYLENAQTILEAGNGRSAAEKIDLLLQTLEALAYLHRRGILHRDLKPDNVLVVGNTVRLLDFGLAAAKEQATESVGSWQYMAPEVLQGEAATESADLYAVGVLAFQLFARAHPFNLDAADVRAEIIMGNPEWHKLESRDPLTAVSLGSVQAIIRTLLAKQPDARYATANQTMAALYQVLGQPVPPETAEIRESYLQAASFVGRETEIALLTEELNRLQTAHAAVWLIGGESGVGKSRLIEELRTYALINGWQVLRGQAVAEGGAYFHLWREIVSRLVLSTPITDEEAAVLRQIVPKIAQLLNQDVPDSPAHAGADSQHKLASTLLALLGRQTQPALLLLEDLHWSIESLLPLQILLTDSSIAKRLMIVGTYRDDEKPTLPQALDGAKTLLLKRFDQAKTIELCQAMLGEQVNTDKLIPLLIQETEGNTYFLVEAMRALAEEAGQLTNIAQETLPTQIFTQGMAQLLQRRIYKMLASDHELLQLAAVAGRQLDMKLLQFLQADYAFLEAWLQRAADAAILTVRENRWLFAHDKLREAILANLNNIQQQWLHEQVALAIEAVYPHNRDYNRQLVELWHVAQNLDKELYYLPQVVEYLIIELDAYLEAGRLLERGLQAVAPSDGRVVPLLNWLAHVNIATSKVAEARQYAEQAQSLAEATENWFELGMSLMHLGGAAWYSGDLPKAQGYYEKCLAIFEKLGNQRYTARSHRYLGTMNLYQDRPLLGQAHAEKALALFEAVNDRSGIMLVVSDLADMFAHQGRYKESFECGQRTYELATELGNKVYQAIGLMRSGMGYFHLGELEAAKAFLLQALEIAQQVEHDRVMADLNHILGIVTYGMQTYAEALTYLETSLTYAESTDNQWIIYSSLKLLVRVALHVDMAKAKAWLQRAFAVSRTVVDDGQDFDFVLVWAKVYLLAGQPWQSAALVGCCAEVTEPFERFFMNELRQELEKQLTANELQAALATGSGCDWEQERNQFLSFFEGMDG